MCQNQCLNEPIKFNKMSGRRKFLKSAVLGSAGILATQSLHSHTYESGIGAGQLITESSLSNKTFETPSIYQGMPIHATFLDEVSWDIPHQNWGVLELSLIHI